MKFQRQIPRGRVFFKDEVGRKPSRYGFRKETMFIHLGAQCSHFVNLPISKGELPNFTDQILQLSPIVNIYIYMYIYYIYTQIYNDMDQILQISPISGSHVRNSSSPKQFHGLTSYSYDRIFPRTAARRKIRGHNWQSRQKWRIAGDRWWFC